MTEPERKYVTTVPRDESERFELLASRPVAWEHLLFAYHLRAGLERTEEKWRDYSLGYTLRITTRVSRDEVLDFVQAQMAVVGGIVGNVERVISERAQEAAFGLPGEPGDPKMIEHMANRLIQLYESMLDWASEFLAHQYPDGSELGQKGAALVWQPAGAVREFVTSFISSLEGGLARLALDSEATLNLSMTIKFEMPEELTDDLMGEVKRIVKAR